MKSLLVVFGNQLFAPEHLPAPSAMPVYLAEDMGLCTYERHHQQKIVLFLAAMRAYADELRSAGFDVIYSALDPQQSAPYEGGLEAAIKRVGAEQVTYFEVEDKAMEERLRVFLQSRGLTGVERPSPMFTCSRATFREFAAGKSRLLMGDFYKSRRRALGLLMQKNGEPEGGRWSFDTENRRKLPAKVTPPAIPWTARTRHADDVVDLVEDVFAAHPGSARQFAWPTTRAQAREWLVDFAANRLDAFGPYEDAISTRSDGVFHSLLSPYLNMGLLTPDEVLDCVLEHSSRGPLQSVEGFVRQVIGWREFIRGVYREHSERQDDTNFWGHEREFTDAWYYGTTGLPPLDDAIETADRLGWTHHIQRLMVLGNMMTLCEIRPTSAHRWFMEMFVDSSEWVMGPNVYGMGIFSDGGLFATKPYICGSNYWLKMSDYRKGPWCDTVDGLYWRFIDKHREFFSGNPRLALMPRALDRLDDDRKANIFAAAETFLDAMTVTGAG